MAKLQTLLKPGENDRSLRIRLIKEANPEYEGR